MGAMSVPVGAVAVVVDAGQDDRAAGGTGGRRAEAVCETHS